MKNIFPLIALIMIGCNDNLKLYETDNCSVGIFTKSLNNPQVVSTDDIYIAISSQSSIGKGIDTQFTGIKFSDKSIENFRLGI